MKHDLANVAVTRNTSVVTPVSWRFGLLFAAVLSCTVLLLVFQRLELWSYDFTVPFNYAGDTLVELMYIKGLLQDGWPTTITHLSAPFSYPGAAFPMLTSTDWLIIKAFSVFTVEPGYLLNVFWLASLVLSALSASYAAYQLRLSTALSFASGLLYALLPYAFLRNVSHLSLVYFAVPLLCLLAVAIMDKDGIRNYRQVILVGLFGCVIQGFDYVYYSFFAAALFCIAALISFRKKNLRGLKLPLVAITVLVAATAINLLPGVRSWQQDGRPPEIGYKFPAEAELYGAKIRRMLVPHQDNPVLPLAAYAKSDATANFPNENENATVRLGLYGATGLLLMLFYLLRRAIDNRNVQPEGSVAALGLVTLLFITVGGFGAVFNLLVVPDIRAYNRFSVFLSFFTIVTTGFWVMRASAHSRLIRRFVIYCAVASLVAFSLHDQLLDSVSLVSSQQESIARVKSERTVVREMERIFPNETAVLELPFTGFPIMYTHHKMFSYDHVRPYLWSTHLKWSWPSFSVRHRTWQEEMSARHGADFVEGAILSGFHAIWIDRFAYEDGGKQLLSTLSNDDVHAVDVNSERYAVLDLRDAAEKLRVRIGENEFNRRRLKIVGPRVFETWRDGFYSEERDPDGKSFHWAGQVAALDLRNPAAEAALVCVQFDLAAPTGEVRIDSNELHMNVAKTGTPRPVMLALTLAPRGERQLRFRSKSSPIIAPGDPRQMYFSVRSFSLQTLTSADDRSAFCQGAAQAG